MDCGLKWVCGDKQTEIINRCKHIVYVRLNDSNCTAAVDIGHHAIFDHTCETTIATLSYYTEDRDTMNIFLNTSGSYTISITPMVKVSCYTKDCELKDRNISRRNTRKFNDS
jgi:hypothetical protein